MRRRVRKRIVRSINVLPTLLTLGNAFCGFLALAYVADAIGGFGDHPDVRPDELLKRAAWLVFLGMCFDALDGRIARLTKTDSAFGAELDSLCDVITFAVTPAFLVKVLVQRADPNLFAAHPRIGLWMSVLFVACAILRLARYNVENVTGRKGPTHYFVGLPTPAAAGVLAALVLLHFDLQSSKFLASVLGQEVCSSIAWVLLLSLPLLMVGLAILMVSRVPFMHAVNRLTRGRRPITYVVTLVFVLLLAIFFTEICLAIAFSGYVVLSIAASVLPGPWKRDIEEHVDDETEIVEDDADDDLDDDVDDDLDGNGSNDPGSDDPHRDRGAPERA